MRLPLYLLYKDWHDRVRATNAPEGKSQLCSEKRKFCGALVSNQDGRKRNEFMDLLMNQGLLESGGSWKNNIGRNIQQEDSISFRSNYRFFLAFENSSKPGYITEKILGAMAAGCIPVYWGAPDVGLDFNEHSFINCHRFDGLEAVVKRMKELWNSPAKTADILSQPWLEQQKFLRWNREAISKRTLEFIQSNLTRLRADQDSNHP